MTMELNAIYRFQRGERTQLLVHGDITTNATFNVAFDMIQKRPPQLIYSDPPWNPGNEKYWRNHAGASESTGYEKFLDAWWKLVVLCEEHGAEHLLVEQAINSKHLAMFSEARERSGSEFALAEEFTVYYGSPGAQSVRRPNVLLHYVAEGVSHPFLYTDPTNMAGEPMTIRACAGLQFPPASTVVDFCMGKGMTSRMAHYFDWDCIGVELNEKRLAKTIEWLLRQGYQEVK